LLIHRLSDDKISTPSSTKLRSEHHTSVEGRGVKEEMRYKTGTMEMVLSKGDKTDAWPTPTPAEVELTRGEDNKFHKKEVV
jgi:hypothetical protein